MEIRMTTTVEKTAWPAQGIREDSRIDDYVWGYLRIDATGQAQFDDSEQPTRAEILARWSHYLKEDDIA
jgi:hypothetical protein